MQPQRPILEEPTASFYSTCFNCLNALSGIGILSVPYALALGGWISLLLLFAIAATTFYTGLLILRCMIADPTIRSFPDIGERAFGKTGKIIALVAMNMELYLVTTGFLILESDNLTNLFPELGFDLFGIHLGGKKSFVVIVAAIVLPTVWFNNMSFLSYISATGVLASVIIVGSLLWVGMFGGVGFMEKGDLVNWNGVPTAIGLYAFCYGAHAVFPTLYTSMRNPHHFKKVLFVCFFFCTITYSSMAILGYRMYGLYLKSQITLNLPTTKMISKVAIWTIVIIPIAKYAVLMTPIVDSIEEIILSSRNRRKFSFIIRTTLVISSVILALTLPFFGYLMSLVGALFNVTVSIILPCLCYLKISGTYRNIGFELVSIGFIVIVAVVVGVMGTYISLVHIVKTI